MAYKISKDNRIKHEYSVLSNILNPTKRARSKIIHYPQILQGCMSTRGGRGKFRDFLIILNSGSRSTIVVGKLVSKIKQKKSEKNMWETQVGKFTTYKKVNVYFCLP